MYIYIYMCIILYNHHLCLWIHDVYNVYNILKICKTIQSSLLCPLIAPWKSKDWSLSRSQRCCTATPAGKSICLFLAALDLGFQLPPGIAGTVTPACPASTVIECPVFHPKSNFPTLDFLLSTKPSNIGMINSRQLPKWTALRTPL